MSTRTFSRPQAAVRGFFGLGPEQFNSEDTVFPIYEIDPLLQTPADTIVLSTNLAAVAPGVESQGTILPPAAGAYFLDFVSLESAGPATSGSWTAWATLIRARPVWAGLNFTSRINLIAPRVFNRAGGVQLQTDGGRVYPPILVVSRGTNLEDAFGLQVFNSAASVGNLSATLNVWLRPMEGTLSR